MTRPLYPTVPSPWFLDEDTVRDATGHGVCRLDWEDEQGQPVRALLHDSNVELILQAPALAAQVAGARELITLWRGIGHPMLLAAAKDLEERLLGVEA